ncbi:AIR synthase-related protein [Clostridium liquoris]|jgi:selenide,water dikinase|nr:AIR synthase-related protein [Clostridium liquoris]
MNRKCYSAMNSTSKIYIFITFYKFYATAKEYANMGIIPEGTYRNKDYLKGKYDLLNVPEWLEDIVFDPQTSGGLLFSISKDYSENIMKELSDLELESSIIGEVIPLDEKIIIVE